MSSAPMGVVLTATAVVSSPSLWMLYEGSLAGEEVLKRVLVCLALCWVGLNVLASLAFPTRTPAPVVTDAPDPVTPDPHDPRA